MKALLISLFLAGSIVAEEISAPIFITKDGTTLENKVYSLSKKADCPMIVIGDPDHEEPEYKVKNVTLKNIVLFGNKDFQTTEYYLNGFLRNNCITVRGAENIKIENVVVAYARSGGVVIEKKSKNITINGINSFLCFFDGLALYECTDCMIMNGVIHSNDYAGISMDHRADKNRFYSLSLEANLHAGIFMRDCNGNFFNTINFIGSGIYMNKREEPNTGCSDNYFLNINAPRIYAGEECERNFILKPKK